MPKRRLAGGAAGPDRLGSRPSSDRLYAGPSLETAYCCRNSRPRARRLGGGSVTGVSRERWTGMPATKTIVKFVGAAALAAVIHAAPLAAQDAPQGEDRVIAVVNGHEIKASEVAMASDDIVGQLPDLPPKL